MSPGAGCVRGFLSALKLNLVLKKDDFINSMIILTCVARSRMCTWVSEYAEIKSRLEKRRFYKRYDYFDMCRQELEPIFVLGSLVLKDRII